MPGRRRKENEAPAAPPGRAALGGSNLLNKSKWKEVKNIEFEAKEKLMARLDGNLLDHAKQLTAGDGPSIVEVYRLQGLAEMHCYLKTSHQFDPAEVDALLQFADPLNVAYYCGEMNSHEYSFPICDLLRETEAREWFAPAEPELPEKPSVRQQLHAAMKEARQHLSQEAKTHGGDAR